ncbi:MAG: hypothetical protein R3C32_07360 [Chloroflexota bacterium]
MALRRESREPHAGHRADRLVEGAMRIDERVIDIEQHAIERLGR